ncbi:response regulator transcription factor [Trinickia acidisoli]|uniref:response regulator transcription factor n=1 Tax=Trinickia acidisoli TaxID=2767482 RepID=UPI001A8E66C7|nr:response regulator transcription factor [Trinickia acidisoli]
MKIAIKSRGLDLVAVIKRCLEAEGAVCRRFGDDLALLRGIVRDDYDAILIDAEAGAQSLQSIAARRASRGEKRAPLVVINAAPDRENVARLLEAGADDVVFAPVDARDLSSRLYLAQLRVNAHRSNTLNVTTLGEYRLDKQTCTAQVGGDRVSLTAREFAIAWLLFSYPGEYLSRQHIAKAIWSASEDIVGRTLEQHIYRLRQKLRLNGALGVTLRTLYGYGYRIECSAAPLAQAHPATTTAIARSQPWTPRSTPVAKNNHGSMPVPAQSVADATESVGNTNAGAQDSEDLCTCR